MSLMLRKASQEILDEYNLADYHAGIQDDTRYMQVVGPCGKPLLTISGVIFTSKAPTNKEIEFATSLLSEFLVQHSKSIQDLLIAKTKLASTPTPSHPKGVKISGSIGKEIITINSEDYPDYTFTFHQSAKTIRISKDRGYDDIPVALLTVLLKDKKVKADIATAVKTQGAYWSVEAAHDDLLSAVQTCNV